MSLVEKLFPPAELAAMKHAVLSASEEPAAKRRRVERQNSTRSRHSTDSGYNSEDERASHSKPTWGTSLFRNQSIFGDGDAMASTTKSLPSALNGPSTPTEDVEDAIHSDFTSQIARARARLYSNASIGVPSPPSSAHSADSPAATTGSSFNQQTEYHSPVTGQHTALRSSGFSLSSFACLGLAVSSYEQSLLDTLLPVPEAHPRYITPAPPVPCVKAEKPQHETSSPGQKTFSYQGFAISMHDDDEDEDERDEAVETTQSAAQPTPAPSTLQLQTIKASHTATLENLHDFFNIEAASEDEIPALPELGSSNDYDDI